MLEEIVNLIAFLDPLNDSKGKMLETAAEVVEEFNMYFGSVFTNESDHVTPKTPVTVSCTKIEDLKFTEEVIRKKLLRIREDKAPGAEDTLPDCCVT